MKTTAGAYKPPFRGAREIRTHKAPPDGGRVNVRWAKSLKDALEDFFKEMLSERGFKTPIYKGNVLQVIDPEGEVVSYVAYEVVK